MTSDEEQSEIGGFDRTDELLDIWLDETTLPDDQVSAVSNTSSACAHQSFLSSFSKNVQWAVKCGGVFALRTPFLFVTAILFLGALSFSILSFFYLVIRSIHRTLHAVHTFIFEASVVFLSFSSFFVFTFPQAIQGYLLESCVFPVDCPKIYDRDPQEVRIELFTEIFRYGCFFMRHFLEYLCEYLIFPLLNFLILNFQPLQFISSAAEFSLFEEFFTLSEEYRCIFDSGATTNLVSSLLPGDFLLPKKL